MFFDGILGRRSGSGALRPRLFSPVKKSYFQEEIRERGYEEQAPTNNPRLNILYSYIQPFIGEEYGFDVDDLNGRLRELPPEDQASIADLVLDGPRSEEFDAFRASLIPVRLKMVANYLREGLPIEDYASRMLEDYHQDDSPRMQKIRESVKTLSKANEKYR